MEDSKLLKREYVQKSWHGSRCQPVPAPHRQLPALPSTWVATVMRTQQKEGFCCVSCRKATLSHPHVQTSYLGVRTDRLAAFNTGVGAELVKALQAAVVAILFHVLLPLQGVPAVVAVKFLRHGAHLVPGRTCGGKQAEQMTNGKASVLCRRGSWDSCSRSCRGCGRQGNRYFTMTPGKKEPLTVASQEPEGQWLVSPWGLGRHPSWHIPLCCIIGH